MSDSIRNKKVSHREARAGGFTLIEIIVATSLFLVVMTISTGALLAIIDANTKAQSLEIVMNNLNFALESMARNIRVGFVYSCGAAPTFLMSPVDCATIPLNSIAFQRLLPGGSTQIVVYAHEGTSITQSVGPSEPSMGNSIKITSDDVIVEDLSFYVVGTDPYSLTGDDRQPRVLIKVRGEAGTKANLRTKFAIQTTVTMRRTDL